uniref:Uncharacterized protein n=1 Tax=Octactis speculum TaxID=3111310 RepID=A0A7S2MCA3_9STRA
MEQAEKARRPMPLIVRLGKRWGLHFINEDGENDKYEGVSYQEGLQHKLTNNIARGVKQPDGSMRKLGAGDNHPDAQQYDVYSTTLDDLGDFGLGVGLYFSTLLILAWTMFFMGLLNINAVLYYSSASYSGQGQKASLNTAGFSAYIPGDLMGSAWCPNERMSLVSYAEYSLDIYGEIDIESITGVEGAGQVMSLAEFASTKGVDDALEIDAEMTLAFNEYLLEGALKHDCPYETIQGYIDMVISIIFIGVMLFMGYRQGQIANDIDGQAQTSQDYAILVDDPGLEDIDVHVWKDHFEQFGDGDDGIMSVTVAYRNGVLLTQLINRRAIIRTLNMLGWANKTDDDYCEEGIRSAMIRGFTVDILEETFSSTKEKLKFNIMNSAALGPFLGGIKFWTNKLNDLNRDIKVLLRWFEDIGGAKAGRVYVLFTREEDRNICLDVLSIGSILALMDWDKPSFLQSPEYRKDVHKLRFDSVNVLGEEPEPNVLAISQAPEPEDVNWENLDYTEAEVTKLTTFFGTVTCSIVAVICMMVWQTNKEYVALAISAANGSLLSIMKEINKKEPHPTKTRQEAALLFKLVLARWAISGVIFYVVTDWSSTVKAENIKALVAILLTDAIMNPVVRLCDFGGLFLTYVKAPASKTQEGMNECFKGAEWFLAERFADLSKTILICMCFSAIVPQSYFITGLAVTVNYWADKYCLFRIWQVPPMIDSTIVATARTQLSITVVFHCFYTLHYIAGWPFDSVNHVPHEDWICKAANVTSPCYAKTDSKQQWSHGNIVIFDPPDYLDEANQELCLAYQRYTAVLMTFVLVIYLGQALWAFGKNLVIGSKSGSDDVARRPKKKEEMYYKKGKAGEPILGTDDDVGLFAYVPQIRHPGLIYPQMATFLPDWEGERWGEARDETKPWFPKEMNQWQENETVTMMNTDGEKTSVTFKANSLYDDPILNGYEKDSIFSHCRVFHEPEQALAEKKSKKKKKKKVKENVMEERETRRS